MSGVQYNETLYDGKSIKEVAKAAACFLPRDVTHLVSRGSSGCALASALMVVSDLELKHIYIRKDHETSHGSCNQAGNIFYINRHADECVFCFVDDFIDGGRTLYTACERLACINDHCKIKYALVDHVNCKQAIRSKFNGSGIKMPTLILFGKDV